MADPIETPRENAQPPPQQQLRLADVDEVAEALGISRWQAYRFAASGTIPSVRIGRSLRFELAAVVAALRAATPPPRPRPAPAPRAPRPRRPRRSAEGPPIAHGAAIQRPPSSARTPRCAFLSNRPTVVWT